MGTNYYYKEDINPCKCCGRPEERKEIHIGKSSCGWNFLFGNYHDSYDKWVEFVKRHDGNLYDEYDRNIPADYFINNIFQIKGKRHNLYHCIYDGNYDISTEINFC